jgi:hypothetical protein
MRGVVELAGKGKLKIAVGRVVRLNEGISLIRDLERGARIKGKGLIVMGAQP